MLGNNDYGWTPGKAKREADLPAPAGSEVPTPRFQKAYLECLDDTGAITRLEPLYDFAQKMEREMSYWKNQAMLFEQGYNKLASTGLPNAEIRRPGTVAHNNTGSGHPGSPASNG